jgi:UDP-3-O-acyl-N-acetylglucosamine deacetylase
MPCGSTWQRLKIIPYYDRFCRDTRCVSKTVISWEDVMDKKFGEILYGQASLLENYYEEFNQIPVDLDLCTNSSPDFVYKYQQTIEKSVEAAAPGTFNFKKIQTVRFESIDKEGWWFKREDLAGSLPVQVACKNARTTNAGGVRNIVLDGVDPNYVRLVEHIIALKAGLDIDNLMICVNSDDPPLFESGSIDLIKALDSAGRKKTLHLCRFYTVKETVSAQWDNGSFIIISPLEDNNIPILNLDCCVNYNNVMGKQRIKYTVSLENFKIGAQARTDASLKHAILCKTIGKIFPATRNLGYNRKNVLIAGQSRYYTKPKLLHNGKSLESVWHRATLDLLAAVALIGEGRFLGNIVSYKAGHAQDVELMKLLYKNDMFKEVILDL